MCFVLPDELLRASNLTEREMLVELVCRLFDIDKVTKQDACRVLGVDRVELDTYLISRGLKTVQYTQEMIDEDLAAAARRVRMGVPNADAREHHE